MRGPIHEHLQPEYGGCGTQQSCLIEDDIVDTTRANFKQLLLLGKTVDFHVIFTELLLHLGLEQFLVCSYVVTFAIDRPETMGSNWMPRP